MTSSQLIAEIQFLLLLKTLILASTSVNSCLKVGTINSPFSSAQPYEGTLSTLSINAKTLILVK